MRVETVSKLSSFPDRTLLKGFEGGGVYLDRERDDWLVITDESSMAGMLDEEDLKGLDLIKVYRFESEAERDDYLRERRWI